jgi:alanine racemase
MIDHAHPALPIEVWLKMNSGMNRAGFLSHEMLPAWQRLKDSGKVGNITLMTHFARADEPEVISTTEQIVAFDAATREIPGPRSLANSGAILGWPAAHRDWARPGILLYGADPMPGTPNALRPVMTLESSIMAVREIPQGAALGYGARFCADRPTRVGLVAIGYADGYPRTVPNGTPVAVDGIRTRLIGRVSMDMLTVDLTDLPQAGIGSRVELWGNNIPVNRIAEAAGTISYELLCNVKRVRFEYPG